jgi:hypothetical protein
MAAIEPTVTYQGFPSHEASFRQPFGIGAGTGHIVITQADFDRLIGGNPWAIHPVGGGGGTGARGTPGAVGGEAKILRSGLLIRGPLIFKHERTITLPQIYISDGGIEDVTRSDELRDRGTVRLTLMSVTGLWGTRGDIYGEYNILTSDRKGLTVRPGTTVARREVEPGSTRFGKPYTLADMVRLCLSRLPGNLSLVCDATELKAAEAIEPVNMRFKTGQLAAQVMAELLSAFNFRGAYDPISDTYAIWRFNSGRPSVAEQGIKTLSLNFPTAKGAVTIDPATVNRTRRTNHNLAPRTVRILGKPIIREVEIELEPCGERDGDIRPLDEALIPFGFTIFDAARWVLLPRDQQNGWTVRGQRVSAFAADEMRRWAFKWFRVPPELKGFLPMLPLRAEATVRGGRRGPIVWADTYDEVKANQVIAYYDLGLAALELAIATGDQLAAKQQQGINIAFNLATQALGPGLGPAERTLTQFVGHFTGLDSRKVLKINDIILNEKGSRRSDFVTILDYLKEQQRRLSAFREEALRFDESLRRRAATSERAEIRLCNRPVAPINSSQWKIVAAEGVVQFSFPIGCIRSIATGSERFPTTTPAKDSTGGGFTLKAENGFLKLEGREKAEKRGVESFGLSLAESCVLEPHPRVRILFAYESTPDARAANGEPSEPAIDKAADYVDCYSFLGELGPNGEPRQLNPGGKEPANSAQLYPRVVKTDFRMYASIDNDTRTAAAAAVSTNRGELDSQSIDIMRHDLGAANQTKGEEGESLTFWPITVTGGIPLVGWAVEGGLAKTTWTVGVERTIEARAYEKTEIRGVKPHGESNLVIDPGSGA